MKKWIPVLATAIVMLLIAEPAFAEVTDKAYRGIGAGMAIGFAGLGGALGQGMAARGVYESISRNPQAVSKLNAPFYVGMAFIESLVIFSFVIAFTLTG